MSEISPPQIRGFLLCLYGFIYAIGQLLASVVLYVIQNSDPLSWRRAIYTEWAFHGFWIFCGLIWLPESPWYHAKREEEEKTLKSLRSVYKKMKAFDPVHEMNAIKYELEQQKENAQGVSGWIEMFKGSNRIRTFGAGLAIGTQIIAGTPVIFTYTTYFVQTAGIGEPFLASLIVTIILLIGLIVSFFAVETLGRRTLMVGGGISCTICNFVVGITGCFPKTDTINHTALAFVFLWVFSYGVSFAGVSWAMVGEASTSRLKPMTAAFATGVYDLLGLIFTLSVPYMLSSSGKGAVGWGTKTLFLFAIINAAATVGNYFLCPEVSC